MKGIYKGFKYTLSQMFVVKEEREIEIGYPTDVKHVAHIGWDGPSGSAPSWMNEFKTGPNFAAASIGNIGAAALPWSTRDLQSLPQQSSTDNSNGILPEGAAEEVASTQKKQKRKKAKSTSSPKAGCSTSRSSRMGKSKSKFMEGNAKLTNIEVA